MPRKKAPEIKKTIDPNVVGLKAEVISQPVSYTHLTLPTILLV